MLGKTKWKNETSIVEYSNVKQKKSETVIGKLEV